MNKCPNYIKLINWFWDNVPHMEGYKSVDAVLFLAIVDSINRNTWQPTSISFESLITKCRIGKRVYLEAREWLLKNKLIEITAGKNAFQMARFNLGIAVLNGTGTDTATQGIAVLNGTGTDTATQGIAEKDVISYGDRINLMEELMLDRYDNKIPFDQTHITTNLTVDEIESRYGTRVRSRMREMFNLIELHGSDMRK